MLFLDWQSDGVIARLALFFYGIVVLLLFLPRIRKNPVLQRLLPAAFLFHLVVWAFTAFSMLPHYAAETGADCHGYHDNGLIIADLIRSGDWSAIPWGWNTEAMQIITGFLYAPLGGDVYGMLGFSAVLGLCGSLYLCLAFSFWVTPAQLKKYAAIVLFLPSFAMWTGIFGKDSWIAFGLGFGAYGYSKIVKSSRMAGLGYLLFGIVIVTIVRPHIAVALVASMGLAYVWGLASGRRVSIFIKLQMVPLFVAMFVLLASVAQGFLGLTDVSLDSLQAYGATKGEDNQEGGSTVAVNAAPGVAGTLRAFPRGIVRVLFQPFPWEVRNFNSGLAAAENLFILWFILSHFRRLRKLFQSAVREPYVLFSSTLSLSLLLMFSLLPNLGLLSRERAQLLPFIFVPLVAAAGVRKRGARFRRMALPLGSPYRTDEIHRGLQPVLPFTGRP